MRDQAVATRHLGHDQVGGAAPVEAVGAPLLDAAQDGGEVRLLEALADGVEPSVGRGEIAGRGLEREELVAVAVEQDGVAAREVLALGEGDGGRDHVGERQPALGRVGGDEPGDGARHAGRAVPRPRRASALGEHLAPGRERRLLAEVPCRRAPVGPADDHEPAAAQVARVGADDGEGEPDGDGRVDGVAAVTEHLEAGAAGLGVARRDHRRRRARGLQAVGDRLVRSGRQRDGRRGLRRADGRQQGQRGEDDGEGSGRDHVAGGLKRER